MEFRVDLDMYRGPLDLLLYLVRKHEVDITDIPIAMITEQYLDHLSVLERIDVNAIGDFLDLASTLIETKSRMVLPRAEEEETGNVSDDPRQGLVERLLEYKKYKDAASMLRERSHAWQQHFPRMANDLPVRRVDAAEQPIHEVELWDLVSALGRVMRSGGTSQPTNIVYDETPIQDYMQVIHRRLAQDRRMAFSEMFHLGMHKSAMIGVFLAVLELVRHRHVNAIQDETQGEIWMVPSDNFSDTFEPLHNSDTYGQSETEQQPKSAAGR